MALCRATILVGALLLVTTLQKRIKQANELMPEQMVGQDSQALAEAAYKSHIAKVEEDGAHLGESFTGSGLPQDLSRKQDMQQTKENKGRGKKDKSPEQANGKGKGKGKDKGKEAGKVKENQLVKSKGKESQKASGKIMSKVSQLARKFWFRFPIWGGKWWISRLAFLRGPFVGFIYQEIAGTKTLLVKSWKALEEFGDEVILPQSCNYVGAKVGDKILFDVKEFAQEGEGKPRPMAKNVIIRQRGHEIGSGLVEGPALTNVRTQVLYYISDENLRTDKFFQDIIATTEGGWISTDFLLLCKRLRKLGASTKSIIDQVRDAPGVEVRDMPGNEAIRRTSPPPPLEHGAVLRIGAALPIVNKPLAAKATYSAEMMKSMGDVPLEQITQQMIGQDEEELAEAAEEEAKDRKKAAVKKAKKAAVAKAAAKKAAAEKPAAKKALPNLGADVSAAAEVAAAFAKRSLLKNAAAQPASAEQAEREEEGAQMMEAEREEEGEEEQKEEVEEKELEWEVPEEEEEGEVGEEEEEEDEEEEDLDEEEEVEEEEEEEQEALIKKEAAAETTAEAAEQDLGEPEANTENPKSWQSWFSALPRAAWGHMGRHAATE